MKKQTVLYELAAFGPVGTVYRLSYPMVSSQRGSGPTQIPGTNIVSRVHVVNTLHEGNIQEP